MHVDFWVCHFSSSLSFSLSLSLSPSFCSSDKGLLGLGLVALSCCNCPAVFGELKFCQRPQKFIVRYKFNARVFDRDDDEPAKYAANAIIQFQAIFAKCHTLMKPKVNCRSGKITKENLEICIYEHRQKECGISAICLNFR